MRSALVAAATEHAWRLDLSSLAAILAAAGTGLLAFYTWRLARETRSLAKETGEDVRAEWRPVLIAATKGLLITSGGNTNVATVVLPLVNVGKGPAINATAILASVSSVDRQSAELDLGTVAQDATIERHINGMLYRDASGGEGSRLRYEVEAVYTDLAGRRYRTVLHFTDPERGARPAPVPDAYGSTTSFQLTTPTTTMKAD